MKHEEKIKMFNDVFAPKSGEKVLFLIDMPHDNIKDNTTWKDRRKMAKEWYQTFKELGAKKEFTVDIQYYDATGVHNAIIPQETIELASTYNLLMAMTEYSGTSSFLSFRKRKDLNIRGASMPTIERRMETTAFKADYQLVQTYADNIKDMLIKAVAAKIHFSTGDQLFMDLRNRQGHADGGDCTKPGQFINFPSGEGYIAPYEAADDEIEEFGESKTEGILPDNQHGDLIKYKVEHNRIVDIIGEGESVDDMRGFFNENASRRNIAELGVGCNPNAVVTGNILEDEKVSGLHIAYGMSIQLDGKVKSDMHQDICFPKGLPAAAKTLTLINEDGSTIDLIQNSELQYDLIQ